MAVKLKLWFIKLKIFEALTEIGTPSEINPNLKKCDLTQKDYTKLGFWTGSGDKKCTDPKVLNNEAPLKIEGGHFASFLKSNICKLKRA